MNRVLLPLLSAALLLQGCTEKVVTIPGPEVVRLVPARIDPRLLQCMDVPDPQVEDIPENVGAPHAMAIMAVIMQRFRMGYLSCRSALRAIEETQAAQP
jgi:hypothetical protein